MPKEIAHWITAERTRDLIAPGRIKEAISKDIDFFYLGAVVYDSPFYAIGIKQAREFGDIAGKLHGLNKADTYTPF